MSNYKDILVELVDTIAKYDDRAAIFRRNDIPRAHFYNVTNDDRLSSSGKPYHTPLEWVVKLTRDAKNYCMLKKIAKDCDCILITPDDVKELKSCDPAEALAIIQKVVGLVK